MAELVKYILGGVYRHPVYINGIVKVGPCGPPRIAKGGDTLAPYYLLTYLDIIGREMSVPRLNAMAVAYGKGLTKVAVTADLDDGTVSRCVDRCSWAVGYIEAVMVVASSRKWRYSAAEVG